MRLCKISYSLLLYITAFSISAAYGQNHSKTYTLNWTTPQNISCSNLQTEKILKFENCNYNQNGLPLFVTAIEWGTKNTPVLSITDKVYEHLDFSALDIPSIKNISNTDGSHYFAFCN